MNKSLLLDARLILEKPTGIGQYLTELVPELLQLAPNFHFHLLCRPNLWPGYNIEDWQAPNLTRHTSQVPHMNPRQHLYIPKLARELNVSLIHYPHFDAPIYWRPVPVVATIYDVKYLAYPQFFTGRSALKTPYMRFSYAQTMRRSAAVLTISDYTKHDLVRFFHVPKDHIHTTYLAASTPFQPTPPERRNQVRAKFALERPFILSVGERRPHKNFPGLIRAYAHSQSRTTHDLVIVGQAYQDYTLPESTVQEFDLARKVHFLTDVNVTELANLYSAATLFVLVSFYEGFGLPLLEAMACGTPVIASNTTATGEILGSGGFQVNPHATSEIAAAIDMLLTDHQLRTAQIERGFARQRQFSWQKTAEKTLAVYEQVLKTYEKT